MPRFRTPGLAARALACAVGTLFGPPANSLADVIVLKDGTRLDGELTRTPDGYDVTTADGKTTKVTSSQVKSVEVTKGASAEDARPRLESLRRSVENMSDLKLIISRYNEYLRRFAGTDAADDAMADLKTWEGRLDQHMTKVGGKWVTPEELGAIQEEAQGTARKARDLIAAGRLREAGPLIDVALRQDPASAPALFLRGVVHYRQEQLGPARKAFDAVAQLVPDHGPTLNNLAVILWRQEQHSGALKFYDAAMIASAADERILANVAEALHALPKELRGSAGTKKVVTHFQEREAALVRKMERRGLYRWGAAWVRGEELDRLQEIEREIDGKIKDLEDRYKDAQDRVEQIDRDVAETQRSIRRIEAQSYTRDASGRMTKIAYPRVYYELQRDVLVLKRERADQVDLLEKLRKEARLVRQELPVPRYTGIHRIIEVEGTPLIPLVVEEDTLGRAPADG